MTIRDYSNLKSLQDGSHNENMLNSKRDHPLDSNLQVSWLSLLSPLLDNQYTQLHLLQQDPASCRYKYDIFYNVQYMSICIYEVLVHVHIHP